MTVNKKILLLVVAAALMIVGAPNAASAAESIIINFEVGAAGSPYLRAIPDTNGRWQIGYGSTWNYDLNRWVQSGDRVSPEQALRYMRNEIREKQELIDQVVLVPINRNQRDSLISFGYNIGTTALKGSTLLRLLNAGADLQQVANEFDRWVYAEGRIFPGLVKRRAKEKALFLS